MFSRNDQMRAALRASELQADATETRSERLRVAYAERRAPARPHANRKPTERMVRALRALFGGAQ